MGPEMAVIGRLFFTTGGTGCLDQVQPCYANGIHVVDCSNGIDRINSEDPDLNKRLGRICVLDGGRTGCDIHVAVEETSWGKIKASYRGR
jgi:hypothetical protein